MKAPCGFKPYIYTYKHKKNIKKDFSVSTPSYFLFKNFNRWKFSSYKLRIRRWHDYYSTEKGKRDLYVPPSLVSKRIKHTVETKKKFHSAKKKFSRHFNKLESARRRSKIDDFDTSQDFDNSTTVYIGREVLDSWWWDNNNGIPPWFGETKTVDYHRMLPVVPWLEENIGQLVDPPMDTDILYGHGWKIDFRKNTLTLSKHVDRRLETLFILKWL